MSLLCLYIFWELMKVEGQSPGNRLEAQLALLSHPVMIWYFPQAPSLSFPL